MVKDVETGYAAGGRGLNNSEGRETGIGFSSPARIYCGDGKWGVAKLAIREIWHCEIKEVWYGWEEGGLVLHNQGGEKNW